MRRDLRLCALDLTPTNGRPTTDILQNWDGQSLIFSAKSTRIFQGLGGKWKFWLGKNELKRREGFEFSVASLFFIVLDSDYGNSRCSHLYAAVSKTFSAYVF